MRRIFTKRVGLGAVIFAVAIALAGCSEYAQPAPAPQSGAFTIVPVYYATDRSYQPAAAPAQRYGVGRGEISYGVIDVSIPRDHRPGSLEAPSLWRLELRPDPDRHITVLSVSREGADAFFTALHRDVAQASHHDAFVFIHGYNTSFEEAARRTAQLAYDLHFDGVPILYTWPSQGELLKYVVDANNADWTVPHLERFLGDVAARSGASTIHLIGHSLGNRVLVAALEDLARRIGKGGVPPFTQVVLTAPDIDADVFRQHASRILGAARHVTMYASRNDVALHASESLAAFPRAGDTRDGIVIIDGIDTIDASAVDTSFVGHDYFAESASVISDMGELLRHGMRADQRIHLRPAVADAGRYWIFSAVP